jgi:hypothetical protein
LFSRQDFRFDENNSGEFILRLWMKDCGYSEFSLADKYVNQESKVPALLSNISCPKVWYIQFSTLKKHSRLAMLAVHARSCFEHLLRLDM